MNRRKFVGSALTGAACLASPYIARAQSFTARQVHSQPDTSHLHIFLSRIWDTVRAETNGRLDVSVRPRNDGMTIGPDEVLDIVRDGGLEFFTLNGNILSRLHPVTDIQGIPFAFTSAAQATGLWDGELGAYMAEEVATTGIRLIPYGGIENGVKQIISVDKPVLAASDLEGFRMRVPAGELFVDFYNALGATPQIINFVELRGALANGETDGLENPLVVVEENRLYETCNHISITNHQWAGFNMLANEDFWQALPEDLRDVVIRNTQRFVPEQRAYVRTGDDGLNLVLRERGMVFHAPDLASFRARLTEANFYARWRERVGNRAWEMMEEITGPVG